MKTEDTVKTFNIHVKKREDCFTDIYVGDELIVTIEKPGPYRIVTPIEVLQNQIPLRWYSSYKDIYRAAFRVIATYLLCLDYGTEITNDKKFTV